MFTGFFQRVALGATLFVFAFGAIATDASATETTTTPAKPAVKRFYRKFIVSYEPTKIESMQSVRDEFKETKYIDTILDAIAQEIRLPKNVPVTFKDCGDINASWSPTDRSITFCYELIDLYNRAYTQVQGEESAFLTGATQKSVVIGTTIFILMHELGHGFIDMYNIPATGREEDAVDQFATIALTETGDDTTPLIERPSRFALLGAYFFKSIAENPSNLNRDILADEHALGQQRYYDVMCLVLGANTKAYQPILTPGVAKVEAEYTKNPKMTQEEIIKRLQETDSENILPQARAIRCEAEYKKYAASWEYLTDTFMTKKTPVLFR